MGIILLLQSVHITTDLPYTKFGMTTTVHVIGNQGRKLNTLSTPKMHNQVLLVTKLTDTRTYRYSKQLLEVYLDILKANQRSTVISNKLQLVYIMYC